MPYSIFDIDVAEPLPTLTVGEADTGAAFLVREQERPIGFWMESLTSDSTLSPDGLARRIDSRLGTELLQERLRKEMRLPERPLPPLTVAICTKDRPSVVERCLEALQGLKEPPAGLEAPVDVLVVDNAPSNDRTYAVVNERSGVRYEREPRPGLNFARNRALAEASGELLAFLDDDVVVDAGWLSGLAEAYAENPDAAAFTGQVLPYELETEAQILFEKRGGFRRGFEKRRYGPRPEASVYPCGAGVFGTGANMVFRRNVVQELGGFDEALDVGAALPGGGDHDIFYRIIRQGRVLVYEPSLLVFHQHRRTQAALRRQYEHSWGRSLMVFVMKSYHTDATYRPRLRRLVAWWFKDEVKQLLKSLIGRHVLPPRMILAELRGGLCGILGGYYRSLRRTRKIRQRHA